MSAIRRVEAQTRTAGLMVAAGADRDKIVIRLVGVMKTLRSVGSEIACRHVGHCATHGLEHGPEAGAAAAQALAEAIQDLMRSSESGSGALSGTSQRSGWSGRVQDSDPE